MTDALLSGAEALLARLGSEWDGGCGASTREALRATVELGLVVRDASLLDLSFVPVCSVGAEPAPLPPSIREALLRDGRALWEESPGSGAVRFAHRFSRGAGQLTYDPLRLSRSLTPVAAGERFSAEVRGAAGAVLRVSPAGGAARARPGAALRLVGRLVGVAEESAEAVCNGGGSRSASMRPPTRSSSPGARRCRSSSPSVSGSAPGRRRSSSSPARPARR